MKLQDIYLKKLNIIAGLDENERYDKKRSISYVSTEIYDELLDTAEIYSLECEYIQMPPGVNINKRWLYDVVKGYFKVKN